ncbi:TIGR03915 family putative DNA repair protein [Cellulophaga omnivescoria]|uniref:TIGR03915 family putative DNA repair protein n=1 Tax=Cellulophaga omnivescoria TaxID=1888890 RepID=UPI0022F11282|nr:TIGR03915 family putative DNA repair protein [Cellulophaga omnivescoria]WBU89077.1 TIGR03915 family putative DNA repair protein [Cellulophaga omnivescoria]WKB81051.1 TIGR03915 family putative DNA repair protein [Cellulophaga lytica]
METTLIYDGTFDGFLTAVFTAFELKLKTVKIVTQQRFQQPLFGTYDTVYTNQEKANRVWAGLKKKMSTDEARRFYYAFLSEKPIVEDTLYNAIVYVFASHKNVGSDFTNKHILEIAKLTKNVGREKHRMEAFVRFKLTKDGVYFANIEPDFNVLPLIKRHFEKRYADQKWLIYDLKRKYGLYYNLEKVDIIKLDFDASFDPTKTSADIFAAVELEFQQLWNDYFKSTNIESRKNMKLHIQHVPKRYWKYLSEKHI